MKVHTNERPLETSLSDHKRVKRNESPDEDCTPDATLVAPPDGGWGWVVVAASFMCNFLVDGIIFSGGILLKPIQLEFHASDREVAPVNSLLAGFYLLGGPFVSVLANKYGFRTVTIIGSLISSAAFGLSYFATSVGYLYISYGILGGLGFCMIYMPAVVIVGFYFERWRALAIGLALCGSGVGTFVLAPLTEQLIENFGWRVTVLIHGGFVLLCLICGAMFRPLKAVPVTLVSEEEKVKDSIPKLDNYLYSSITLPCDKKFTKTIIPRNYSDVNAAYINTEDANREINRRGSENLNLIKDVFKNKAIIVPAAINKKEERRGSTSNVNTTKPLIDPFLKAPQADRLGRSHADLLGNVLYREDVFYGGSLKRLPEYTSRISLRYLAITQNETKANKDRYEKCHICSETVRKTLSTMLDVSLFRSPTFIILSISGFFTMLGLFVPYMFVKQRAEDNGMGAMSSVLLVSSIGVANIIGRVACGLVSSMPKVSSLLIYNVALSAGGITTMVSGIYFHDVYQFGYCVIFGLSIACFASLRSILVVDYIGLEQLTSCFGLFLLFQGFGALLGSPIAGALIDLTGSYDIAFYVSGGFILLSGIICYPVDYICRWEKRRKELPTLVKV